MAVRIQFHSCSLYVINAHAPIRRSPPVDHEDFALQLQRALAKQPPGSILIGGADLNARLAVVPPEVSVVGGLASHCPHNAVHAQELVHVLQRHNVHLANTFLDSKIGQDTASPVMTTPAQRIASIVGTTRSTSVGLSEAEHESITTWFHAGSKKSFQIDFIMADKHAMDNLTSCSTLPWAYLDLYTFSDHRPVVASFLFQSKRDKATMMQTKRHKSEQHLTDFKASLSRRLASYTVGADSTAFDVTQSLQNMAREVMHETRPRGRQKRSSWISDEAWTLMNKLNVLRKLAKAWKHDRRKCSNYLPVDIPDFVIPGYTLSLPRLLSIDDLTDHLVNELAIYIKAFTKKVRTALRHSKKEWLNQQCGLAQNYFSKRDTHEAFHLVKQISQALPKRMGAALMQADGTVTKQREDLVQIWSVHWMEHFSAQKSTEHGFHMHNPPGVRVPFVPPTDADLPLGNDMRVTAAQVTALVKSFDPRSSAPDNCPHAYWHALDPLLAHSLSQSMNECYRREVIPDAWSGSLIVPICKKGKTPFSASSYRPIQLMRVEAKLFSKLLLQDLARYMTISAHQFGHGSGVSAPLVISQQFLACAADQQLSTSLLFIDIAAAYDSISHQLLIGSEESSEEAGTKPELILQGLQELGLSCEEATKVQAHFFEYPHHLFSNLVPPKLRRLLEQWVKGPWMQLPLLHVQDPLPGAETMKLTQGIRQGDCISTFLFCVFFDVVLGRLKRFIEEETTPLEFPSSRTTRPVSMTCTPPPRSGPSSAICLLAYADDLLIPLANRSPRVLVQQLRLVMQFALELFKKFHLRINLGKQKTEVCLHMLTKEAKPILQHLRNEAVQLLQSTSGQTHDPGRAVQPCIPFHGGKVEIVDKYPYLGRWSGARPDARHDLSVRKAMALSTFALYKKVLCSPRFTVFTRLHLFRVLVRCHLVQNSGTYGYIPQRQFDSASRAYVVMLKKVVLLNNVGEALHVPDHAFLHCIGEPSLEQLMDARILVALPKLVTTENPLLAVALSCTSKSSLWTRWFASLSRFKASCVAFQGCPDASASSMAEWYGFIIPAAPEWRALVKKTMSPPATTLEFRKIYKVRAADLPATPVALLDPGLPHEHDIPDDDLQPRGPHEIAQGVHECPFCGKQFTTNRGLATHKLRQHNAIPPLALRVRGTVCISCGSQLGTRSRLLGHLQDRLACGLQ
eukprot:6490901-Amphidinium_carterae.1